MLKLTPQDVQKELSKVSSSASVVLFRNLNKLQKSEGLMVGKNEWKLKTGVHPYAYDWAKKNGKSLSVRTVRSGWLVIRNS